MSDVWKGGSNSHRLHWWDWNVFSHQIWLLIYRGGPGCITVLGNLLNSKVGSKQIMFPEHWLDRIVIKTKLQGFMHFSWCTQYNLSWCIRYTSWCTSDTLPDALLSDTLPDALLIHFLMHLNTICPIPFWCTQYNLFWCIRYTFEF